jgi:hypothetical protein
MDAVSRHNERPTHFFSQHPAPLGPAARVAALSGEVNFEVQAEANLNLEAYVEHVE